MGRRLWSIALLAMMSTAHAANIDVVSLGPNKPTIVTITGTIDLADKEHFLRKISTLTTAIVAFDSDGGNLFAGLQIGETIRLKNFSTLVPDNRRCASSCALAWLGGTTRFMGSQAQVGFHAAYIGESRQVTSTGNALVGAYLNKIGLPYDAVIYITSASPESITWLNKSDAEKLGIQVSLFSSALNLTSKTHMAPSGPTPPPQGGRPATASSPASKPAKVRAGTNIEPATTLILPTSVSPKYSTESEGMARMHTCVDQYVANKATDSNGGLKWIERGGGYYTECNKRLK